MQFTGTWTYIEVGKKSLTAHGVLDPIPVVLNWCHLKDRHNSRGTT